jgi:hypothetical protein
MLDRAAIIGIILMTACSGYLLGRITTVRVTLPSTPVTVTYETGTLIPVVTLDETVDGMVTGSMKGTVRLFVNNAYVLAESGGSFRFPITPLLKSYHDIAVPSGMRFVASKRGKKYYPIASASASALAPQNRIYFRTREEAEKAGFTK